MGKKLLNRTMMQKVFVKGNIVVYSGNHLAKGFVALASCEDETEFVNTINGDLNLYEDSQLIPYYTYYAKGGITVASGSLRCISSPLNILNLYQSEIDKIEKFLSLSIPDDLRSVYNRHLFIGIIGAFELFLTEMITCLVLGEEDFYNAFVEKTNYKISLKDIEKGKLILDRAIYKVIHNINTHKLNEIKELFNTVFGIKVPDIQKLGEYIKKRHDLVHRNGNRYDDRKLIYVDISNDEVISLINVSKEFVDGMMSLLSEQIRQWDEGLG